MTKSHVAHHFNNLDIRNTTVPLMMLLISHDANAGTIGVT